MTEDTPENAADLLKKLADADNHIATIRGQLKAAEEAYEQVADRIFKLMDEQGTETIRNSKVGLQVSIGETQTDIIEDYDKFTQFVMRHKLLHFLQRRLSPVAIREYLGMPENEGKKIPGLGKFTKRRLHVTTISK